jgi:beta-mannosidase
LRGKKLKKPLQWTVGYTHETEQNPDRFVPAVVPGAVQLDWAAAQNWPPIEYQANYTVRYDTRNVPIAVDYEWMEDVYWLYRAILDFDVPSDEQRLFFICGGVDYRFQIRLENRIIWDQEGMFTPVEIDITDKAQPGDILEILIYPVPKQYHTPVDEKQSNQSCKPAMSYGWDFHPRLIPLGIWQETYLEIRPALYIRSAEVFYELTQDFSRADLRLDVITSQKAQAHVKWIVRDPAGQVALEVKGALGRARQHLSGSIRTPDLWWPNGQGEPSLYTSITELYDEAGVLVDTRKSRIGFRKVFLIPHALSWDDPDNASFPNSRNKPPITLEINGRSIFAKGSNWVGRIFSRGVLPTILIGRYYRLLMRRILICCVVGVGRPCKKRVSLIYVMSLAS